MESRSRRCCSTRKTRCIRDTSRSTSRSRCSIDSPAEAPMPTAPADPGVASARRLLAAFLAGLLTAPPFALGAPEGEQVVSGEVSFAREGDLTQIHAGDNSIIEYL